MNTNISCTAIENSILNNQKEDNVDRLLGEVRQRQYPLPAN